MTEKEYRSHPAVSRSELWRIRESPERFKYFREHPEEPTPALLFGQAFHKLALEPETFDEEFAVAPDVDRRTKAGKEEFDAFTAASVGKTVIPFEMFDKARGMCDALYRNDYAKKLLSGEREKTFFWTDELTGEECKCRVDCLTEIGNIPLIVDLKSTSRADTESFMRDAVSYGYDFQNGMYGDGVKANVGREHGFVFIAIEKELPYSVNIMQTDKLFARRGYDIFRELIGIYHDCKVSGNWYGYLGKHNVINSLGLPAYLAKEVE